MSQKNDHDFRDQHKILVLEMLTNPGEEMVTKILLHSVMQFVSPSVWLIRHIQTCQLKILFFHNKHEKNSYFQEKNLNP